jgi:hypothetical protein
MPFSGSTDPIWEGISAGCRDVGFRCLRADQLKSPGFIVDQIYSSIAAADIIVGEMSDRNANVFYEVGYAHAIGKPTILLAARAEDLKAFDTAGFRHFLHSGDPATARKILFDVLPQIDEQLQVEPVIPGGKVLFEWPLDGGAAPAFAWPSQFPERHLQIDLNGGQRILDLSGGTPMIAITNTDEFWNHRSGHSIMKLAQTPDLSAGDIVHLLLEGRCSGDGRFDFAGDGGWVDTPEGRKFSHSWAEQHKHINPSSNWKRWLLNVTVQPSFDYDLKRGTAIYLLTTIQKAAVFLKKIKLIQRHPK